MSTLLDELQALQTNDAELIRMSRRLKAGPEEIAQSEAKVQTARDASRQAEEEIRRQAAFVDECNLEIKTSEAELTDVEEKIKISKNSKEYQLFTKRIKELKQKISDLETEGVEAMETLEELRTTWQEKCAATTAEEEALAALREEVGSEESTIREEAKEFKAKRVTLMARVKEIDPEAIEIYESALKRGRGEALALMVDGVCQVCFRQQSPNVANLVTIGKDIKSCRCAGCGRILYAQ